MAQSVDREIQEGLRLAFVHFTNMHGAPLCISHWRLGNKIRLMPVFMDPFPALKE